MWIWRSFAVFYAANLNPDFAQLESNLAPFPFW